MHGSHNSENDMHFNTFHGGFYVAKPVAVYFSGLAFSAWVLFIKVDELDSKHG